MDIYIKIIGEKLMKIWLLRVFGICLWLCISIFLFTKYSNGQLPFFPYGYQQYYNPNNFYMSPSPFEDPYRNYPFLDDDYEPPPDWSNWNWTDPWTAYDPSGGSIVHVDWQPELIGTSPFFRQTGYNPWNQPYNYGWNQHYPFGYGYQQSFDPYGPGYQQSPIYNNIPSFNGNEYWDPYRNTWMVYDQWNNMSYEKFIPYNGNPNPYPSPWGQYGRGYYYVGYPPPTPEGFYPNI